MDSSTSRISSLLRQATRSVESRGVIDVWLFGITAVISGQFFGWNVGLHAGVYGTIISSILVGGAYLCFCCCVSEVTGALPFAGGSYGLARCTLGFFPAFLIGCCEAIGYIGSVATAMIAMAGMVVQVQPAWTGLEPIIMLILYTSILCVQLAGATAFWVGNFVLGTVSLGIWFVFFCSTVGHTDFQANVMRQGSEHFVGGASKFLQVFPFSAWFFIGIEVLNLASDDFRHPKFTIPHGQVSCAVSFVVMSTATLLVTVALPRFDQELTDVAMRATPLNVGLNLGLGLSNHAATALSIPPSYAAVYGFVWSYTKLLHAMASSRLLPPVLATTSAHRDTAYVAMITGTLVSYTVCVAVFYKPTWSPYVLSVALLFAFMSYTGQCVGYISLKYTYLRRHKSEFTSPFGVVGALYAICVWVLGFVCLVFFQGNGGKEILVFIVIVATVTVYYHGYSKKRQTISDKESKVLMVAHVMKFNNRRSAVCAESEKATWWPVMTRTVAIHPKDKKSSSQPPRDNRNSNHSSGPVLVQSMPSSAASVGPEPTSVDACNKLPMKVY